MSAVSAMPAPLNVASPVPAPSDTKSSRARTLPIHLSVASMTMSMTREWNSTSPMRKNMGMAMSVKVVTESNTLPMMSVRPTVPPVRSTSPMMFSPRNANATGMPVKKAMMSEPKMMPRTSHHSIAQSSLPPTRQRIAFTATTLPREHPRSVPPTRGLPAQSQRPAA